MKMVSVTLEGLWMSSDRIVGSQFFVKFHMSGFAIIFSFWTIMENVSYPSKKVPNQAKDLTKKVIVTLEGLLIVSDRIVNSRFFDKFHRSGPAIIFSFWAIVEQVSYLSKKLLIKPRFIMTYGEYYSGRVCDRIVDSRLFVKFHRSGPAIIFSF